MFRTFMQNLVENWRIVGLLGFLIAILWFVHARRTVIRGWCSARYGGRLTRRHNPFSFWGEVYISYLLCAASLSAGLFCVWRLVTRT